MPATEADVLLALDPYSRIMAGVQGGMNIASGIQSAHANSIKNRYLSQSLQAGVKSAELKNNAQTITNTNLQGTLSAQNAYKSAMAHRMMQSADAGIARYTPYTNYASGKSGVIDKFTGMVYPGGIGSPTNASSPSIPSTNSYADPISPVTGTPATSQAALSQVPSATADMQQPQTSGASTTAQPSMGGLFKSILSPMRQYSGTNTFYQQNPDQSVTAVSTPTTQAQELNQLRSQATQYANYFLPGISQVTENYGGAFGGGSLAIQRDIIKANSGDSQAKQKLAQALAIKGLQTEIGNELAKGATGSRPAMRMAFATANNILRYVPNIPAWEVPDDVKVLSIKLQKKYYNQAALASEKVTQEGFPIHYPKGTSISKGFIQPSSSVSQSAALPSINNQTSSPTTVTLTYNKDGKSYKVPSSQVSSLLKSGWSQ